MLQGQWRTVDRLETSMGVENLAAKKIEDLGSPGWHVRHHLFWRDPTRQPERPLQTFGDVRAELGEQTPDYVHELHALLDQKIGRSMQQ